MGVIESSLAIGQDKTGDPNCRPLDPARMSLGYTKLLGLQPRAFRPG